MKDTAKPMTKQTILALDLGTGSARAALVDMNGHIQCAHVIPLVTNNPKHGWVEQRPADWWHAIKQSIALLLKEPATLQNSIVAICCCGQMHAAIPVARDGSPVFDSIGLWNDKRTANLVNSISARPDVTTLQGIAGNPVTTAWPALKFAWYRQHYPDQVTSAARFLLPKDYINFQLTGEFAIDRTEAGSSFLFDARHETWSIDLCDAFGIEQAQLAELRKPNDILGFLTAEAAAQTGLKEGLPVIVGAGDYTASLLGSGMTRAGKMSDITGTSFLLTSMGDVPFHATETMNVADAGRLWGAFAVVDAAGDSVRWARRFLNDTATPYSTLLSAAENVPPGSDGLLYLPYLTGERLGDGAALKANILNLTAAHSSNHMHRAVMEGVSYAMLHNAAHLFAAGMVPETIICSGGGSRAALWNRIKANVFNRVFLLSVVRVFGTNGSLN